jgi:dTDP-glucose 4,6-dehydratase
MLSDYAEPVNIGNPDEMTILEFAKEVLEIIKSDSNVVFKDLPMDDPKVRRPDISKAKKVLDWEPKIGLETGLKKTIDFFRNLNYIPI